MPQFDPSQFSERVDDKLQAAVNRNHDDPDNKLPTEYLLACATWLASLSEGDRLLAESALRAYISGDEVNAARIAAELPPAPIFPFADE